MITLHTAAHTTSLDSVAASIREPEEQHKKQFASSNSDLSALSSEMRSDDQHEIGLQELRLTQQFQVLQQELMASVAAESTRATFIETDWNRVLNEQEVARASASGCHHWSVNLHNYCKL